MQRLHYFLNYIVDASKDLAVPEAHDTKTALFDEPGAPIIFLRLIEVLASVELDHESCLGACEVSDKVSDRELSAEPELVEPFCSQPAPQLLFRICFVTAEPAGAMVWKGDCSLVFRVTVESRKCCQR